MPVPPPPPPPGPPPPMSGTPLPPHPPLSQDAPSKLKHDEQRGRNALLADIQKGARLKKVMQINDRSAPAVDKAKSNCPDVVSGAGSSTAAGSPAPSLGGLFAGGFPVLKPAGKRDYPASRSTQSSSGMRQQIQRYPVPDGGNPSVPDSSMLKKNSEPVNTTRDSPGCPGMTAPAPPLPPSACNKPAFSMPLTPYVSLPPPLFQERPGKDLPSPSGPLPPSLSFPSPLGNKPTWLPPQTPATPLKSVSPPPPPALPPSSVPDRSSGIFFSPLPPPPPPPPPMLSDNSFRDSLLFFPPPPPQLPTSYSSTHSSSFPPPPPPLPSGANSTEMNTLPPPPPPPKMPPVPSPTCRPGMPPPPPSLPSVVPARRPPGIPRAGGGGRLAPPPAPPARSPSTELSSRNQVPPNSSWGPTPPPPPPPPPFLKNSQMPSLDDFESKFHFHSVVDFPPPEEYKQFPRVYPSKEPRVSSRPPALRTQMR
ncbi:WAS/WASL-interacting protein family member 3 [Lepisosteus oculatus]|uniref:WAS/WASL-interacting protein family member 3 n=1 Tax=Lepisosteus oculatus TaxID=7918 RepID=UPI0035F505B9